MATKYRLDLVLVDEDGKEFILSYNNHKGTSTDQEIKTFVNSLITNGDFLKRVPVNCVSATKVELNSIEYDLS